MSNIEPLTAVDAAWLRMEDSTNLMMVSGILTFREPVDIDKLRDVITYRLLQFDRFRMRVVDPKMPLAPAYWEFDPSFDLDAHIHRVALPEPGDYAALQEISSDLMSTPLDFSKPLWMVHVIENFEGGTAIFIRLHHCIADGMALVYVLLSLTDFGPELKIPAEAKKATQPRSRRGALGGSVSSLLKRGTNVLGSVRDVSTRMIGETRTTIVHPTHAFDLALDGGASALAAGRLVMRSSDPQTIFKGKLGTQKRAAWSRPLSLKDVKAIKNVTGATVNDVLVSALTGGLRRYLLAREQPVDGLTFRAAVPINMRTPEEMGTLGNKFGILFLNLPVGYGDPLERLAEIHERMEALKGSKEGAAGLAILGGMGVTPTELHGTLVEMFGKKLTAVMTNVPGPPMPLYMAGSLIDGIMFWVPQSGRVGLGVSIISYAGKVFLGVATDAGLVPDPDEIIDGFYAEFDELLALAREAETIETVAKEAPVAAPPAVGGAEATELQSLNGIGPKSAERLQAAGIESISGLAELPPEKLADILKTGSKRAETILAEAQQNGAG